MDFLFEGRFTIYGGLILTWVGLFIIWTFSKFNHFSKTTMTIAFLIIGYGVLDKTIVTDKENAEIVLKSISKEIKQGSINFALKHLDERFITAKGTDLKSFETWLTRNQADKLVKDIIFWDIENISSGNEKKTCKISCMVKIKGDWGGFQEAIYRVEFLFQTRKDRIPTILSFQVFDPVNQNNRLEIGI
ncbi:MAG: hypothetical protein EBT92_05160 [Planctomycetes bacterium]|nr:hypothetical protein [Planctomycetota bacterium]NBY01578.1 hypothetical protein [Planctomycetota bacterium]